MFLKYSRETITTKPRFEVTKEIATSSRIRAINRVPEGFSRETVGKRLLILTNINYIN